MGNWIQLYDNSDPTQLSRTGKICKRAGKIFEDLEYNFIHEFGVNKEFKELQALKIEIEIMKCRQIHTGDRSSQIHIDLMQDQINEINKAKSGNQKLRKLVAWVEFEMGGMAIDTLKTTTFEFYNRVNFILEKNGR